MHERTPGTSSWTSQHEFGRTQLDTVFEGKVETAAYFNAVPGKNADALVEQAITDGADVVFTTSPKLVGASLRAAVQHPQVHILNCSMEMPYASIRTYYTRVYEAKFITGAIAGAMAGGDRIGYVADYPSFGVPANINAFALGARMTNPNVRIDLQWTCLPDQIDPLHVFTQKGITVISGRDAPMPNRPQREFGTFLVRPGGVLQDLATPFWHWGQFYENVIRTVLNGGWVRDKSGTDGRAVNYWWGMNSGVMDVLLSRELPPDVTHLAQIAAMADTQYRVQKNVIDERTYTTVTELDKNGRIDEVARLIGVSSDQQASGFAHARALLNAGAKWKKEHLA